MIAKRATNEPVTAVRVENDQRHYPRNVSRLYTRIINPLFNGDFDLVIPVLAG
jgi:hypothetical protein